MEPIIDNKIRLQKYLAEAGIASRRKSEELIKAGKIKVNGRIVKEMGVKIRKDDKIEYQGKLVKLETNFVYIALNKPIGYVSSTNSRQGKSVLDLIEVNQRIYPVGRLDKDSSGLILLTNDGQLTNKITHPKYGSAKEYFVVLDRPLDQKDADKLKRGLRLGSRRLQPVEIIKIEKNSVRLILREGINRQIRRMMGRLGYRVEKLKRIRIGKLELGGLKEGMWKKVKKKDII